jgi:hypothetical protein
VSFDDYVAVEPQDFTDPAVVLVAVRDDEGVDPG